MLFIVGYFRSPKEEKKQITLSETDNEGGDVSKSWKRTDSPTTSDVDTDAVLDDSDYGDLYKNEVSASEKAHLRLQAMKKLKAKGVRRKTKKKKALADETEDALKERIQLLSVELEQRNSATKTDEEGPILPPPKRKEKENEKPIEKPIEKPVVNTKPNVPPATTQVKLSPDDVFKSNIAKDSWPDRPTKTVGTETDPMIAALRRSYGTMKASITNCKKEVFKSRFSKKTLNTLDEKLKTSIEGMKELRQRLVELPQLATPDKNKIHEDYHTYDKLVADARHNIQRHLNVLQQKEADQTGGARANVTLETEKKREENPKRKDQDKYFSDDLSKKDKKRNWKEERRLEAEL